jgi:protein ImuA
MRSWLTTNLAARMISHVLYGNTVSLVHCTDVRRPSPFDRFMSADLSIRVPSSAPPASLETPVRWTLRRAEFHAAPFDRPESLHPALWRADQLGRASEKVVPSGFDALDAHLPGGGWPRHALTELLLPHAGIGEIRLLASSLASLLGGDRLVMLFDPPECLSAWALARLGIDPDRLLVIYTRREPSVSAPRRGLRGADSHVQADGDSLWALEQALKSGHVGAVLAWLPPRLPAERMRRLQLAAQAHDGPAFMLREWTAREKPSPAPLRLMLQGAAGDRLSIRVLKRRGPLLLQPIVLGLPAALPASVSASLSASVKAASAGVLQEPRSPLPGPGNIDLQADAA